MERSLILKIYYKDAIIVDYQSVDYVTKIRILHTSAAMKLVAIQHLHQQLRHLVIIMLAMNVLNFVGGPNLIIAVEHQTILMVVSDVIIVDWRIVDSVMKASIIILKLKT